jgi:hypothetical protein
MGKKLFSYLIVLSTIFCGISIYASKKFTEEPLSEPAALHEFISRPQNPLIYYLEGLRQAENPSNQRFITPLRRSNALTRQQREQARIIITLIYLKELPFFDTV